jgi:murein DD-endopeptidase MepM/ murein hydrolase activator NlpD
MAAPPALQTAINNAAAEYGVNPEWLTRIWQFESGGTFPNPAVNSIGCGGLFGLCTGSSSVDPASGAPINLLSTATTQAQANAAAYTLARLLNSFGDIYDAMIAYTGGSVSEAQYVSGAAGAVSGAVGTVLAKIRAFYNAVVTQPFGPSDLSLEPAYDGYAHFHEGEDIGVAQGTPVPALAGGTVSKVVTGCSVGDQSCGSGYGNQVWVRLSDGSQVLYGHLQQVSISLGQTVNAGQLLGMSGNTGASTGPHIHIGWLNAAGQWVDPAPLIQSALAGSGLATGSSSNITTGLPIIGGAVSGLGDIFGGIGSALGNTVRGTTWSLIGQGFRAYFKQGLFLDPLFVGVGLTFIMLGILGLVLGHGDTKQTVKYVAALAA